MSELELQKRQEYKRNRKKWIIIQLIALAVLVAVTFSMFLVYSRMNRIYYVDYMENSSIDYKVQYIENDFFEDEWLEKDKTYISSLISSVSADFLYTLTTDPAQPGYRYSYQIDASVIVANKENGTPYYTVEENLIPAKEGTVGGGDTVRLGQGVSIDFVKYNEIAKNFVKTYSLKNATSTLVVTLKMQMSGTGRQFDLDSYTTSLHIPLAEDTFNVHTTSSVPSNELRTIAFEGVSEKSVFLTLGIVFGSLSVLLAIWILIFVYLTRNEDITYVARVRKILRSYGSFIQRTEGEFDCEGYQLVVIKTFAEMLGIRDTIQSPVLMSENKDQTASRFYIPTATKLLYLFEIRVDNYDEIYGLSDQDANGENNGDDSFDEEEHPDGDREITEENPLILEAVDDQSLAEALAQPDVELSEVEFVPDDDDQFPADPEESGIEVVGVVWPERPKRNKVYRYDPNGETLNEGDIVLVPTRDTARNRDVIRKVAIAHGNHRVDPEHIGHPLKKIIAVVRHKVAHSLTPEANEALEKASKQAPEQSANE